MHLPVNTDGTFLPEAFAVGLRVTVRVHVQALSVRNAILVNRPHCKMVAPFHKERNPQRGELAGHERGRAVRDAVARDGGRLARQRHDDPVSDHLLLCVNVKTFSATTRNH